VNSQTSLSKPYLVFSIGDQSCGLPLEALQEVLLLSELSRPPKRPMALEGFLKLGNRLIPILRLDKLLNLPEIELNIKTPILLLRNVENSYGLLVEKISEIVTVNKNQLAPVNPNQSFRGCLEEELQLETKTVHIFNLQKLLNIEEIQAIHYFKNEEKLHRQKLGAASS
jgi:purine-binding chemotaxis protein CheW